MRPEWAMIRFPISDESSGLCWGSLLYLAFCYWLVYRLKHPLNIMLAVALTVGHSWGSSTWLGPWLGLWFEQAGFLTTRSLILLQWRLLVGYFALVGVCAGISLALYMRVYQAEEAH